MVFAIGHVRLSELHGNTLVHERTSAAQTPFAALLAKLKHSQSTLLEHAEFLQPVG
jgi:hypothetical protein